MKKKLLKILSFIGIIGLFLKETFATNALVDLTGDIASEGLSATSEIMNTPIGSIIYFLIAFMTLMTVVGVIMAVIGYTKNNSLK